jgi:hypothetical protein
MLDPLSVDAAIVLLREVVADLQSRGRTTFAAGIKPQLQRRSPAGFDETSLGFESFMEFVDFAASRGVVEVSRIGGQPVVSLPGSQPVEAAEAGRQAGVRRRPRVRADLWEAFTNWGHWQRAWDRERGVAFRIPAEEHESEPERYRTLREEWKAQPERFVEIPGISQAEQFGWMSEFADQQTGKTGLLLRYALREEERKAQAFSQAIREEPGTYTRWLDLRVERIVKAIEEWKAKEGLDIDICEGSPPADEGQQRSDVAAPAATSSVPATEADLRKLAHVAIDGMTYEELLRLPIQLGHIVRHS